MCSIIGYCGPVADLEAVKAGFQRTASRGPDDSWVIQAGGGLLGFHRPAIMGLTPEGISKPCFLSLLRDRKQKVVFGRATKE